MQSYKETFKCYDAGDEFRQKSRDFVEWFWHSPGTRLNPKVVLSDQRHEGLGRGVIAMLDLAPDEELFAIPRSLVLTPDRSSIPPDVLEPLKDLGSWSPLIVAIIYEHFQGKQSAFYAYLQILPATFDSLMFWSGQELAQLQASAVVKKIGKAKAEEAWSNTIIPVMLKRPDLFPVEGNDEAEKVQQLIRLAHWAGSLIMSYAFDIDRDEESKANGHSESDHDFEEDDEDEPLKGMVPFADMLNADADRNNARLFQEDDCLIMRATKHIMSAEEIFNDYGPLPRSDLLRMYGYVTDNYAQYDVVEFEHDLLVDVAGMRDSKKNAAWLKREEQLDEIGIVDDGYSLQRPPQDTTLEDYIPGNIHMLLRGLCLDENSTKMLKTKDQDSVSIEEAALLSAVATKKLSEYKTSLQEDKTLDKMLSKGTEHGGLLATPRHHMAIQVRMGEKEILFSLIDLCEAHIWGKTNDIANNDKKRKTDDIDDADNATARKLMKTKT